MGTNGTQDEHWETCAWGTANYTAVYPTLGVPSEASWKKHPWRMTKVSNWVEMRRVFQPEGIASMKTLRLEQTRAVRPM
jgi:hypothetical protein